MNQRNDNRRNDNRRDTGGGTPPAGDVFAVIADGRETQNGRTDAWVKVGVAFDTKDGGLSFELEAEPFAWRVVGARRRLVFIRSGGGR